MSSRMRGRVLHDWLFIVRKEQIGKCYLFVYFITQTQCHLGNMEWGNVRDGREWFPAGRAMKCCRRRGDGDLVHVNIPGKEDKKCITKITLETNHWTTVRSWKSFSAGVKGRKICDFECEAGYVYENDSMHITAGSLPAKLHCFLQLCTLHFHYLKTLERCRYKLTPKCLIIV